MADPLPASGLADLQAWMQRAILGGPPLAMSADALIEADARLSASERIALYARGYRARLIECLRSDYPVLRRFAGETVFDLFASDYVAARLSRAPSLYDFGAGFADHLAAARPEDAAPSLRIPAELARIERARAEVGRARGVEGERRPVAADAALVPGTQLRVPESVRLLRLGFDLLPLIDAADRDADLPVPATAETFVAVSRAHYRVRLVPLTAQLFGLLDALGNAGRDVQQAAAEARADLAGLALWLPLAFGAGLVAHA